MWPSVQCPVCRKTRRVGLSCSVCRPLYGPISDRERQLEAAVVHLIDAVEWPGSSDQGVRRAKAALQVP